MLFQPSPPAYIGSYFTARAKGEQHQNPLSPRFYGTVILNPRPTIRQGENSEDGVLLPTKRPHGQPTRGKTARGRLRRVDNYLMLAWSGVFSGGAPLLVDVGYGEYPWTALDLWTTVRRVNPQARLLGVEIDPARVAAAQGYAIPEQVAFIRGGFNLAPDLNARCIRAYNVLRQYDESAVAPALDAMAQALAIGGLLIEGTSTPSGGLTVFDVYQRGADGGLVHRELVFASNLRAITHPASFQAVLPKRLIHHALDESESQFFADWNRASMLTRATGQTHPRRLWVGAAQRLHHDFGYAVDSRPRILRRGYLALSSFGRRLTNIL